MPQLTDGADLSNCCCRLGIAVAALFLLCGLYAGPWATAAVADVSPPVRYQLLSVAVVAGDACPEIDQGLSALAETRRQKLARTLVSGGKLTHSDLADIRGRAEQLVHLQGCQSAAIRDLVTTVRQVESQDAD